MGSDVLFKPTKATKNPFRPTGEDAMSYFVGADAMSNDKFKGEDAGFAINGGRGWKSVSLRNHKIDLNGPTAQAMGDYLRGRDLWGRGSRRVHLRLQAQRRRQGPHLPAPLVSPVLCVSCLWPKRGEPPVTDPGALLSTGLLRRGVLLPENAATAGVHSVVRGAPFSGPLSCLGRRAPNSFGACASHAYAGCSAAGRRRGRYRICCLVSTMSALVQ